MRAPHKCLGLKGIYEKRGLCRSVGGSERDEGSRGLAVTSDIEDSAHRNSIMHQHGDSLSQGVEE